MSLSWSLWWRMLLVVLAGCNAERSHGRVDVMDHGATGDGVTDDLAAITAAFDNLTLGGGGGELYIRHFQAQLPPF